MFVHTFERMNLSKSLLQPGEVPLYGFGGKKINPLGRVMLPVSFGTMENRRAEHITFEVVDIAYPYNVIFGRGGLNAFEVAI